MDEKFPNSDRLNLYTDASWVHGYGAVFENSWFYGPWDHTWDNAYITVKELHCIFNSRCFGSLGVHMANSFCFQCDNATLIYVLNKQSSKESQIMFMIRQLVLLALQYNISFKEEHIPGKKKYLGDDLSRLQVQKCLLLVPEAERNPTPFPVLPQLKS